MDFLQLSQFPEKSHLLCVLLQLNLSIPASQLLPLFEQRQKYVQLTYQHKDPATLTAALQGRPDGAALAAAVVACPAVPYHFSKDPFDLSILPQPAFFIWYQPPIVTSIQRKVALDITNDLRTFESIKSKVNYLKSLCVDNEDQVACAIFSPLHPLIDGTGRLLFKVAAADDTIISTTIIKLAGNLEGILSSQKDELAVMASTSAYCLAESAAAVDVVQALRLMHGNISQLAKAATELHTALQASKKAEKQYQKAKQEYQKQQQQMGPAAAAAADTSLSRAHKQQQKQQEVYGVFVDGLKAAAAEREAAKQQYRAAKISFNKLLRLWLAVGVLPDALSQPLLGATLHVPSTPRPPRSSRKPGIGMGRPSPPGAALRTPASLKPKIQSVLRFGRGRHLHNQHSRSSSAVMNTSAAEATLAAARMGATADVGRQLKGISIAVGSLEEGVGLPSTPEFPAFSLQQEDAELHLEGVRCNLGLLRLQDSPASPSAAAYNAGTRRQAAAGKSIAEAAHLAGKRSGMLLVVQKQKAQQQQGRQGHRRFAEFESETGEQQMEGNNSTSSLSDSDPQLTAAAAAAKRVGKAAREEAAAGEAAIGQGKPTAKQSASCKESS